jgi:Tol biopolymer transport system component
MAFAGHNRPIGWSTKRFWLGLLIMVTVAFTMGGGVTHGEEDEWKIKLPSFSGLVDRVSGDWTRWEERIFRQGDGKAAPSILLFGRNEWVDYRLTMRARIMEGTGGFLVFFRYRDEDRRLWWNLSGQVGIPSGIGQNRWGYGGIIPETGLPQPLEKQKWYEVSLHVSGRDVTGYIDGHVRMEYILPDDGAHSSGRLGFGTWNTVAEFELLELEQFEAELIPGPPSLRGTVFVKGMEGIPIPEAEIKGTFGTLTADHEGQFFIEDLIPGRNMLTITAAGFVPQRAVFNLEEGENVKAFYLRPRIGIAGGKILFFREYERDAGMPRGDLFLIYPESGVERNITQQPGAYFSPRWSPDGFMITFYTLDSREIFVIPAEGGEPEKIGFGISPRWSPDGHSLLFLDRGRLWSIKSDGTESALLFESPTYIKDYSWSPEGNRVLFESGSHIYVVNADGGDLRKIAYPGENPLWSPDGKTTLLISPRGLIKVDIEDGNEIAIAPPGKFEDLQWSPDGFMIAYRKWDEDPDGMERPVLYLIEVNGGKRYRTYPFIKEAIREYRWSPGGNELVLLTGREPPMPNTIYRMELEDKTAKPILDFPATHLQWSPDGEWISFLSEGETGWDIYIIEPDGTGLKKVTDTPETEFQESWGPNLL